MAQHCRKRAASPGSVTCHNKSGGMRPEVTQREERVPRGHGAQVRKKHIRSRVKERAGVGKDNTQGEIRNGRSLGLVSVIPAANREFGPRHGASAI